MPTFALPRFVEGHLERLQHGRILEQIVRETGATVKPRRHSETAADSLTLRGIPAIGRGVAGVIVGTQPESVVASARDTLTSRSA